MMPGLKDVLSIKQENDKRKHVQKRLLLANLQEIYHLFKKEYENVKIGFSKFAELRPPYCVLAGSSGTHNVCVCVHHENVKLMLASVDLNKLTENTFLVLNNYHDCIDAIVCANAHDICYLGECLDCPNMSKLRKHLLECFKNNDILEIKYQSWFQTDRCTIAWKTENIYEYLDNLGEKLMKLKTHDFFAKKQYLFAENLKKNLHEGEFLICCDFAKNYAFVIQNSTQSFHWNNNQATVFTCVVYYQEKDELKHVSIAIISDNLNHDSIAVHEYQKIIISYLKSNFIMKKIFYLTDGASQHFKNKANFQNLLFHERDFGIPAEWHFHATAHGKGACDGIGANLKGGAKRASLQMSSENHILTPEDLYNWALKTCKETKVFYSSKESYDRNVLELKTRLDEAKTIPGTLQYHAIIPINDKELMLKKVSLTSEGHIFPKRIISRQTKKNVSTQNLRVKVTKSKKLQLSAKSRVNKKKNMTKRKT